MGVIENSIIVAVAALFLGAGVTFVRKYYDQFRKTNEFTAVIKKGKAGKWRFFIYRDEKIFCTSSILGYSTAGDCIRDLIKFKNPSKIDYDVEGQ